MSSVFKVIGYRHSRLSDYVLKITSDSNVRGDDMTLDDLEQLIKIKMSLFQAMYKDTSIGISDNKMFIFEDGKLVSLIVERFKI